MIERYFKAEASALDAQGYLDTGDLASIDEAGNVSISGRSKDLIKSGGEWINPAEIEDIVGHASRGGSRGGHCPLRCQVGRAAGSDRGIASRTSRWTPRALLEFLRGKVASWWLPDQIVQIDAMPLAATGKIDKNQLRSGLRKWETQCT